MFEQRGPPYTSGVSSVFLCFLSADLDPTLVLILHPIETTPPGTTEVASEATTEATGGRTTTGEETEAITPVVITRTEVEVAAMATRAIGKVVAVEGGTIARTTVHTVPGGGVPARPRSARAAGAGLATLTARLRGSLTTPDDPATPRIPGLRLRVTVASKASLTPRMQKQPAVSLRNQVRQQRAASSKRHLEVNGLTMTPVQNSPAQAIRKRRLPAIRMGKDPPVAAPCGKALAVCLLQIRAPQSREKLPPSVVLASSRRKMPKTAIRM